MACYCKQDYDVAAGDRWIAYRADNRSILNPDELTIQFDALVTDPPYGTGASGLSARLQSTNKKYRSTGSVPMPDFDGDSLLPEAWQELMHNTFKQSFKLLKPGADLLIFCDWRNDSILKSLIGSLGYQLKGLLVWDKGRGSRPSKNGFRLQSELILWARKPGKVERDQDVYLDGVFKHSTMTNQKVHLTEKPVGLLMDLLKVVPPGGSVLDPFAGSSSTGEAALRLGLHYVGIESTPAYHDIAVNRLQRVEGELKAPGQVQINLIQKGLCLTA